MVVLNYMVSSGILLCPLATITQALQMELSLNADSQRSNIEINANGVTDQSLLCGGLSDWDSLMNVLNGEESFTDEEACWNYIQDMLGVLSDHEVGGRQDAQGWTILMRILSSQSISDAVREKVVETVLKRTSRYQIALKTKASGDTALMMAVETRAIECDATRERIIVAILAKMNPDQIALQTNWGYTALMLAVFTPAIKCDATRERIITAILDKMNPDQVAMQSNLGFTALIKAVKTYAIKCGATRERIITAILGKMNPDQIALQTDSGYTALMLVVETPAIKCDATRERIIALILEKMNPEQVALQYVHTGQTALMRALRSNAHMSPEFRERIVQLLLEKTDNDGLEITDNQGRKALEDGDWRLQWSEFMKAAKSVIKDKIAQSESDGKPYCMEGEDGLPALLTEVIPKVIDEKGWRVMILRDAQELRIGFAKLSILDAHGAHLRLHIFDPDLCTNDVEGIHSHKWNFQSHVLYGTLESEIWKLRDEYSVGEQNDHTYESKYKFRKEIGKDGCRRARQMGTDTVQLRIDHSDRFSTGDHYYFSTEGIHKVLPCAETTATLMLSHPPTAVAHEYKTDPREEYGEDAQQGQSLFAENTHVEKEKLNKLLDNLYLLVQGDADEKVCDDEQ